MTEYSHTSTEGIHCNAQKRNEQQIRTVPVNAVSIC